MTEALSHAEYLDALISTLETHIMPATETDFARGQVVAVTYALTELKIRADWDRDWISRHIEIQERTFAEMRAIGIPEGIPAPPDPDAKNEADLASVRDAGDQYLARVIAWLAQAPDSEQRFAIVRIVHGACLAQARLETSLTPKPNYSKMAQG